MARVFGGIMALFLICNGVASADSETFPRTLKAGDLSADVLGDGTIHLKYKGDELAAVQSVWFMNDKWQMLPRKKNDLLSLADVKESDSSASLVLRDVREDFLKGFEEKVVLTKDSLSVSVDYEYSADIGTWHFPIYLFAQYFEGRPYKAVLMDGSAKEGSTPLQLADKVVYGVDKLNGLKEMTFSLKDAGLTFSSTSPGWNFCDHRAAPWMKTKVFMLLNSSSSKKKGVREHYDFKISLGK